MDQTSARKILQDLIKRESLDNKKCVDCGNPNPQWASLSFAVFMCLQCAGLHRGFGVHISFVRSVSMDTWQEDQIKRMQIGGNGPFQEFMKSYPAEGGYTESMSIYDKYHCWAASQYKEKIDADLAGKSWTQSAPPAGGNTRTPTSPPDRPSSAQGLRKSRAATGRALRSDSASPASLSNSMNHTATSNSPLSTPSIAADQKAANETYFAGLGQANASRPDNLPPSQGGRYQGFGSTPAPSTSQHPSYGLSSAAAPSLTDFQENPVAALSKGWSLFSAAVVGASRAVNENVVRPGMERVTDPNFQATVKGYVSEAGKRATDAGKSANSWGKSTFGVDVADQVGGAVSTVRDKIAGPDRQGYGVVGQGYEGESSSLYQDHDDDDFFGEYSSGGQQRNTYADSPSTTSFNTNTAPAPPKKKEEDWDEWKDF